MIKLAGHSHPPGGFRYFVTETRTWLRTGGSMFDLLKDIKKHYDVNGLGYPGDTEMEQKVAEFICSEIPPGWCSEGGIPITGEYTAAHGGLDFTRLVDGTLTLARWMLNGRERVSHELAEQRGEVCVACRFNQPAAGCSNCNKQTVQSAVEKVVGGARTSQYDRLHACHLCGCALRAKIHIPIEAIVKGMSSKKLGTFPEWCWITKER